MKQTKEYPATHSMSTAWYVADEDGNVGIFQYEDNGPVPLHTESDRYIDDLIFGFNEDDEPYRYLLLNLSDEQIAELLHKPHLPEEEKDWYDCVIQIDPSREAEFIELTAEESRLELICLSHKRGYFIINFNIDYDDHTSKESVLQRVIETGIIQYVYYRKSFLIEALLGEEDVCLADVLGEFPFFIYMEEYDPSDCQKRVIIPADPVKISQFPESLRKRIPIVPIKFSDKSQLQIAEWLPCYISNHQSELVDGCWYDLFTLTDGRKGYVNTGLLALSDYFKYCSEKEKYKCSKCGSGCYIQHGDYFTNKPTVLSITNPFEEWDYKTGPIMSHSIWLPFLPKIPLKLRTKRNEWTNDGWQHYVSEKDIRKHVNGRRLLELFRKNKSWLEDQVVRFNPRVILISGAAEAIMAAVYPFGQNQITINGTAYPMYLLSEVESHREEIERLASLPYQGKNIPHIISVEEMERIKQGKND